MSLQEIVHIIILSDGFMKLTSVTLINCIILLSIGKQFNLYFLSLSFLTSQSVFFQIIKYYIATKNLKTNAYFNITVVTSTTPIFIIA